MDEALTEPGFLEGRSGEHQPNCTSNTFIDMNFLDRRVTRQESRQQLTYEGQMEGLPTDESNQRMIEFIMEKEAEASYGAKPYLVSAWESPISYEGREPYPFGEPSKLPYLFYDRHVWELMHCP